MRKLAIKYYLEGYNCSQCILKAFEEKFCYEISIDVINSLSLVNTGFGIGGMCSGLIAGITLFGLFLDKDSAQKARLKLLTLFDKKFGSINCSKLGHSKGYDGSCTRIISGASDIIEAILLEEGLVPLCCPCPLSHS